MTSASTETLDLPRPIDADLAADVEKQSAYVSPEIRRIRVREGGTAVVLELNAGADPGEARAKATRFLESMTARHRKLSRKVLASRKRAASHPPLTRNVHEELKRRGWLFELGRGQLGLAGPALSLIRVLDAECTRMGKERFLATEQSYPALIPASVLARCGYFSSFPQSVSFVGHLVEDFDRIEHFRQANLESKELTVPDRSAMTLEACLVPAVCYHAYQSLEGAKLGETGAVITSAGKCFRYESSNLMGLERLWDFTMREVIFIGTESQVLERRQSAIDAVIDQLARWDLEGAIETANDPFFPTTYSTKTYWQVRSDLKFELRLAVEPASDGAPRTIAAGSFNSHENFFGNAFGITAADQKPAFTACVGWGLERWVLACFTQHGFDPAAWPEALRASVFSG